MAYLLPGVAPLAYCVHQNLILIFFIAEKMTLGGTMPAPIGSSIHHLISCPVVDTRALANTGVEKRRLPPSIALICLLPHAASLVIASWTTSDCPPHTGGILPLSLRSPSPSSLSLCPDVQLAGPFIPDVAVSLLVSVASFGTVFPFVPVLIRWFGRSSVVRTLLYFSLLAALRTSQLFPYSPTHPKHVMLLKHVSTQPGSEWHGVAVSLGFTVRGT